MKQLYIFLVEEMLLTKNEAIIFLRLNLPFIIMAIVSIIIHLWLNNKFVIIKSRLKSYQKYDYLEFEKIYNYLKKNVNFKKLKNERNHNLTNRFYAIIIYAIAILIPFLGIAKRINMYILVIVFFVLIIMGIFVSSLCKKTVAYKNEIIKNIILLMKPDIEYEERIRSDIYVSSEYSDTQDYPCLLFRVFAGDYMEFFGVNDTIFKLADYRIEKRSDKRNRQLFNGFVAKLERKKEMAQILIERNKLIKRLDRVRVVDTEFEKYFDVFAKHELSAEIILTPEIRKQLVELQKHYGIIFEISIKSNNIFIRFHTGNLFEGNIIRVLNKRKLYKEWCIFKSVLEITEKINEIL